MAQQLKRQQDLILKALGPSFRIAYREVQVNVFFERASHLWFLLFPEPEEEIRVQPGYLDDPDYQEHITIACRKVSLYLLFSPKYSLLISYSSSRGDCAGRLSSFRSTVNKIFPSLKCMDLEEKRHGSGR